MNLAQTAGKIARFILLFFGFGAVISGGLCAAIMLPDLGKPGEARLWAEAFVVIGLIVAAVGGGLAAIGIWWGRRAKRQAAAIHEEPGA